MVPDADGKIRQFYGVFPKVNEYQADLLCIDIGYPREDQAQTCTTDGPQDRELIAAEIEAVRTGVKWPRLEMPMTTNPRVLPVLKTAVNRLAGVYTGVNIRGKLVFKSLQSLAAVVCTDKELREIEALDPMFLGFSVTDLQGEALSTAHLRRMNLRNEVLLFIDYEGAKDWRSPFEDQYQISRHRLEDDFAVQTTPEPVAVRPGNRPWYDQHRQRRGQRRY